MSRRGISLLVLAAGLLTGCQRAAPVGAPRGAIVIVVDALRADQLGCYGSDRPTSPNIDRLAGDGIRFTHAMTAAPWTLPALATLWTSLYPSVHGATRRSDEMALIKDPAAFRPVRVLGESHLTLAEVLSANGFSTAAFVDGAYTGRVFGMAQGFSEFVEDEVPGIRLNVDALLDWLDGVGTHRFFAWLHPIEVHSPYTPKGVPLSVRARTDAYARRYREQQAEEQARFLVTDFDPGYSGPVDGSLTILNRLHAAGRPGDADVRHLRAIYDRGIVYTDYWIGHLIDELKRRGVYDQTIIIVTADHGEELFDHGGLEHSTTFYDEVMRVPLIVRVPGGPHGVVIDEQVGLIDVMPTLLELFDLPRPPRLQGISLRSLMLKGEPLPDRYLFGEAAMSPWMRAMRTNEFKYIRREKGRQELYELHTDPIEQGNLCETDSGQCRTLAQRMEQWQGDMRAAKERLQLPAAPDAEIDPSTAERLRSLGYH